MTDCEELAGLAATMPITGCVPCTGGGGGGGEVCTGYALLPMCHNTITLIKAHLKEKVNWNALFHVGHSIYHPIL